MQPLKYSIAYEKEMVDIIQKMTKWARALPDLNLPYEGKRPTDLGGCMIGNYNPEEVSNDGNTNYYRDEADVHYVPKRSLKDILI